MPQNIRLHSDGDKSSTVERLDHSELFISIHDLSRLISVYFDGQMEQHRLTRSQWWALMYISAHEGASQIELAAKMQMGRASAGKLFERLEAKDWIERRPDETDARIRRIFLREQSREVIEIMEKEGAKLFKAFLQGVTPDQERAALGVLLKMKANAESL